MNPNTLLFTVLAAGMLSACGKKEAAPVPGPSTTPPPAALNATNQPAPAATLNPGFEKLKGRWLRPDGGYIVEIRSVDETGKMDASYFNPKPINVSKAEAFLKGGVTTVFIELRDVNYPGSTYTLAYDPEHDQLSGVYFQALQQQSFEVAFVRTQ
jgi:hypothetical protein